jgi:hypothetical protein
MKIINKKRKEKIERNMLNYVKDEIRASMNLSLEN